MTKRYAYTWSMVICFTLLVSMISTSCAKKEEQWSLHFWETKTDRMLRVFKANNYNLVTLEYNNKLEHDLMLEFDKNDFELMVVEQKGCDKLMKAGKTGRICIALTPPDELKLPFEIPLDIKLLNPEKDILGEAYLVVDAQGCPDSFAFTWADGTTEKTIEVDEGVEYKLKTLIKNIGRSWQEFSNSLDSENGLLLGDFFSGFYTSLVPGQSQEVELSKAFFKQDELKRYKIQIKNQCEDTKTIYLDVKKKQGSWSACFKENGKDNISLAYDKINNDDVSLELSNPNPFPVNFFVKSEWIVVKPKSTVIQIFDLHKSNIENDMPIAIEVGALWQTKTLTVNVTKESFPLKIIEDKSIKHQFNNCEVLTSTTQGLILGLDLVYSSPYGAFPKSIGFAGYDMKLVWKKPYNK